MVSRERDDLYAVVIGQRGGTDQERINWVSRQAGKGRIDVATTADIEDFNVLPDRRSRSAFPITVTELRVIAALAIIGLRSPMAAMGMASTL